MTWQQQRDAQQRTEVKNKDADQHARDGTHSHARDKTHSHTRNSGLRALCTGTHTQQEGVCMRVSPVELEALARRGGGDGRGTRRRAQNGQLAEVITRSVLLNQARIRTFRNDQQSGRGRRVRTRARTHARSHGLQLRLLTRVCPMT
eukprot:5709073-Pleurochrysis_carterae.AAC.3